MKSKGNILSVLFMLSFLLQAMSQGNFVFKQADASSTFYYGKLIDGTNKEVYLLNHWLVCKEDLTNLSMIYKANAEPVKNGEKLYDYINHVYAEHVGNNIQVVYDLMTTDKKKKTCYVRTVSEAGEVSEPKVLTSMDNEKAMPVTIYYPCYSVDKTKLAVVLNNSYNRSLIEPVISLFDSKSFNQIWTKKLPTTYTNLKIEIDTLELQNNGDANVNFSVKDEDNKIVIKRFIGLIKASESEISNAKEIIDYQYSTKLFTSDDKLIQSGFYTEYNSKDKKNKDAATKCGSFFFVTDLKTNKLVTEVYTPFENDAYKKLSYSIRQQFNENPAQKNIVAEHLIEMDGKYYLIGNTHYVSEVNGGIVNTYRELIVVKYALSGTPEWTTIVPRATVAGSHDLLPDNGKLNIIYLEDTDNEQYNPSSGLKDYKELGGHKNANVVCTTIDEKGNQTKKILFRTEKDGFIYTPSNMGIKQNKTFLISYLAVNGRGNLGTITIQ